MMNTLRSRLIVSHIVPLLVILPLLVIVVVNVLQSQALLSDLSVGLERQAQLVAEMIDSRPEIWRNTAEAQAFVDDFSRVLQVDITLMQPGGQVVASSDPHSADAGASQQVLEIRELIQVKQDTGGDRQVEHLVIRSGSASSDLLLPVLNSDRQLIGILQMRDQLAGVFHRFDGLQWAMLAMVVTGLVLGALVGLVLALRLERNLRDVTDAIRRVAAGQQLATVSERGPDEIRAVVQAFNHMVERLTVSQAARRQLLANLVHELGRPLGALRSAIRALMDGGDDDPAFRRELLQGMDDQIERLTPLLDNLAQLHNHIIEPTALNRRAVALGDWLPKIASTWRVAAVEKGLRWDMQVSDHLPTLQIDPDRLAQALGNLLSNAVKYTPADGVVSLDSGVRDDHVWIRVSDSGPGIAPEEQEKVFDPFYRSQQVTRFPQGMGLGLTIARDLITAHSGWLELDSAPGEGCRFTCYLPR